MAVEITRLHCRNKAAMRHLVDEMAMLFGEQLDVSYQWDGDRLRFEGRKAHGHVEVAEQTVRLCIHKAAYLPVTESWIRQQVEAILDAYLG